MKKTSFLVIIVLILGCKKFEQGPLISLRSVSERLEGLWWGKTSNDNGMVQYIDDISWRISSENITITKNGNQEEVLQYKLSDKRNKLIISQPSQYGDIAILRLTDKEMRIKYSFTDTLGIIHNLYEYFHPKQ